MSASVQENQKNENRGHCQRSRKQKIETNMTVSVHENKYTEQRQLLAFKKTKKIENRRLLYQENNKIETRDDYQR